MLAAVAADVGPSDEWKHLMTVRVPVRCPSTPVCSTPAPYSNPSRLPLPTLHPPVLPLLQDSLRHHIATRTAAQSNRCSKPPALDLSELGILQQSCPSPLTLPPAKWQSLQLRPTQPIDPQLPPRARWLPLGQNLRWFATVAATCCRPAVCCVEAAIASCGATRGDPSCCPAPTQSE